MFFRGQSSSFGDGISDIDASLQDIYYRFQMKSKCIHDDALILKDSISFIYLPDDIIRRILFFTHINSDKDLMNLLSTCGLLYYKFIPVAYRLRDVILTEGNLHVLKSSRSLNAVYFIGKNDRVSSNILSLSITSERNFCINQMSNRLERELSTTIPKLSGLISLTLKINHSGLLKLLPNLPPSLKSLSLKIIYSHKMFLFFGGHKFSTEKFNESWSLPNLHYLRIASTDPIVQSHVHNLLYPASFFPDETFYKKYFSNPSVKSFELTNSRWKKNWISFGKLLYRLIDGGRNSLRSIEFGKIDFGLVFNEEYIQDIDYKLPELRMLLIDNVSKMRMNSWLKNFQVNNSELRNDKPCFIVIYDTVSGGLYTKSARKFTLSEDEPEYRLWDFLSDPKVQFKAIKKNLDLYT